MRLLDFQLQFLDFYVPTRFFESAWSTKIVNLVLFVWPSKNTEKSLYFVNPDVEIRCWWCFNFFQSSQTRTLGSARIRKQNQYAKVSENPIFSIFCCFSQTLKSWSDHQACKLQNRELQPVQKLDFMLIRLKYGLFFRKK